MRLIGAKKPKSKGDPGEPPPGQVAVADQGFWQGKLYSDEIDDATVVRSTRIVWFFFLVLLGLVTWSYFAEVVEVSTGQGRVIPSSREQIIESLAGGVLTSLYVREGDTVEEGDVLAQLDLTRLESDLEESTTRYRAALAKVARLEAEVSGEPLEFPETLDPYPELKASERRLYETRREGLEESLAGIERSLELVQEELELTRSLADVGAASNVEVLRLQRQRSELELNASDKRSEYMVLAREELANAEVEADALSAIVRGRSSEVSRLTVRSPVRGVVNDIEVSTIGGVVPPNGRLMEITPLDEQSLIEARISPRDIAYIYPGQSAKVKITAYDYTIYGDLDGEVTVISPDTIQDETNPEVFYYRVMIRTESDALVDEAGTRFRIFPGMIASVDIRTGEKTIFDYLMTPFDYASEALRER